MNHKVLCVVGTRPEAIKMAPVILALKQCPGIDCRVLATAQHRHMLDQVLNIFAIEPDIDLDIMRANQALTTLTARLLLDLDDVLLAERPAAVLAQGDTTTVMTVALGCFYHRIPFGHVEAGLRTGDMFNPFPEEMNRVMAGRLAQWHFAPTKGAQLNLINEGVAAERIFVTGNTVIDSLLSVSAKDPKLPLRLDPSRRMLLVTAHRRENFGEPLREICRAVRDLAARNTDVQVLFPVHPNPNVKQTVYDSLGNHPNVILCEPLEYVPFVAAMKRAFVILTDSGGVQEEAPALGKPVLVLRTETERPEAVECGAAKLVGAVYENIVRETERLLRDECIYGRMAQGVSPYGDGRSAHRIVDVLRAYLCQ